MIFLKTSTQLREGDFFEREGDSAFHSSSWLQ